MAFGRRWGASCRSRHLFKGDGEAALTELLDAGLPPLEPMTRAHAREFIFFMLLGAVAIAEGHQ